jgi:hypothetical protein
MIRPCTDTDFDTIYSIINEAAEAYRWIIPSDRWHEPYMPQDALRHEIQSGVRFWGYEEDGKLFGVMGIHDVQDVTLNRTSRDVAALKSATAVPGNPLSRNARPRPRK